MYINLSLTPPFQLPQHWLSDSMSPTQFMSFFPLGSFVQVAQSFFAGSSALPELSARTSGFPLDCDPSAWLGAPWGQDPVLFLFFIHPRAYTVLGYSKCSIKFVENTVINVVIEMCVQSPVGRPRRENYISILSRAGGRGKMEKD